MAVILGVARPRGAAAVMLARAEFRAGVRSAAFKFFITLAFLLGWSVGGAPGRGAGLSAYAAGEAAWQYLGLAAIIWMSLAAVRDSALRTDVLVFSKPQPTERLVLARFLSDYSQMVLALAALFIGAVLSRAFAYGSVSGFPAYLFQFGRAALILFFASSLSFSLALLANTVVVGALAGLYWILTLAGKSFLAKVFFPAYTQNLTIYVLLGIALFAMAQWLYRPRRRGGRSVSAVVRISLPLALVLAGYAVWFNVREGHDPQMRLQPGLERLSEQTLIMGRRAPGFLLPGQEGKSDTLEQLPDRILIIALWNARDTESVFLLARLRELYEKYGASGVQPVAICLAEDSGAATTFALGETLPFPVVTDWGTHNASRTFEMSPMATAYDCDELPKLVVTDRRRRVRKILQGVVAYDGPQLEQAVVERLAEEPE